MNILKTGWHAARRILGPELANVVRHPFGPRLRSLSNYRSAFRSKHGLEIGGPSSLLEENGPIPIYDVLKSLDNCLYSGTTIWTGKVKEGGTFIYDPRKEPGVQIIADATDLHSVKDASYECVLACHCLEHVANPLRALGEWKRVLVDHGLLLLILPHKDGTFDWRRPTTSLDHMTRDYENGVGEDDLTHLPEILELHDLSKDLAAGTKEQFRRRCLENGVRRAMHHHVFDTMAAVEVVDHMGFEILRVDNLEPCHIIILAGVKSKADNRRFLGRRARYLMDSPFPSDHIQATVH